MKKIYFAGALFLGLLAGCGSVSQMQTKYQKEEAVKVSGAENLEKYLKAKGYTLENYAMNSRTYHNNPFFDRREARGRGAYVYHEMSESTREIRRAYVGGVYKDYKWSADVDEDAKMLQMLSYHGTDADHIDAINENFCKELEEKGLTNLTASYKERKENRAFIIIQDDMAVMQEEGVLGLSVQLQPLGVYNKVWLPYARDNVYDGFMVQQDTAGGIYDRLVILGSQGEAGCQYGKRITVYAKDKKPVYAYFDFLANDSGDVIFMEKEVPTVRNVLLTLGAGRELVDKFMQSCDPGAGGEVNLGGCKGTWSKIAGGYRLTVK